MFKDFLLTKVCSRGDTSLFLKTLKTIVGVIKFKGSSIPKTSKNNVNDIQKASNKLRCISEPLVYGFYVILAPKTTPKENLKSLKSNTKIDTKIGAEKDMKNTGTSMPNLNTTLVMSEMSCREENYVC